VSSACPATALHDREIPATPAVPSRFPSVPETGVDDLGLPAAGDEMELLAPSFGVLLDYGSPVTSCRRQGLTT
jgi:hypothetical protein